MIGRRASQLGAMVIVLGCSTPPSAPEAAAPEAEAPAAASEAETPAPAPADEAAAEPDAAEQGEAAAAPTSYTLHFPDAKAVATTSCDATKTVTREVEPGLDLPEQAVRALLKGPTKAEHEAGLGNPFAHDPREQQLATEDLSAYLRSVSFEGDHLVVDFDPPASDFLLSAPGCRRESILATIERSLLGLPMVRTLELRIDGEPMGEGGA